MSTPISNDIISFMATSEYIQATNSSNIFIKEWLSSWLVHSNIGSWMTASASSLAPEGSIAGGYIIYLREKELVAKFYLRLIKLINKYSKEANNKK